MAKAKAKSKARVKAAKKKSSRPGRPKKAAARPRAATAAAKPKRPAVKKKAGTRKPAAAKKKAAPRKRAAARKAAPEKRRETVLVTGAAGCVGHFVIEELLSQGYAVVATDLPGAPFPEAGEHLTIKAGDLSDQAFTASLAEGVDHIINTAAIIDVGLSYEKQAPVNLEAVKTLYRSGQAGGAKRFIHFSSGSIYAESNRPIDEADLIDPGNDYERTKVDSEHFLFSRPRTKLPAVTIIRPALIYGPRGKVLMAAIAPLAPMLRDISPYFIRLEGGPKTNMVHGQDVARASVFLLKKTKSHGEVYNIADDDPIPFTAFFNVACEAYGLKAVGPAIPYPPLTLVRLAKPLISNDEIFKGINMIAGSLWDRIRRRCGLTEDLRFNLSKEMTAYGTTSVIFNNNKIKELGFNFLYPDFRSGWVNTLEWYKDHRWVPRPDEMA